MINFIFPPNSFEKPHSALLTRKCICWSCHCSSIPIPGVGAGQQRRQSAGGRRRLTPRAARPAGSQRTEPCLVTKSEYFPLSISSGSREMFYFENAPVTNSEGNRVSSRVFLSDVNILRVNNIYHQLYFFPCSLKSLACPCTFGATGNLLLSVISQHPPLKCPLAGQLVMGYKRVRCKARLLKILTWAPWGDGLALC